MLFYRHYCQFHIRCSCHHSRWQNCWILRIARICHPLIGDILVPIHGMLHVGTLKATMQSLFPQRGELIKSTSLRNLFTHKVYSTAILVGSFCPPLSFWTRQRNHVYHLCPPFLKICHPLLFWWWRICHCCWHAPWLPPSFLYQSSLPPSSPWTRQSNWVDHPLSPTMMMPLWERPGVSWAISRSCLLGGPSLTRPGWQSRRLGVDQGTMDNQLCPTICPCQQPHCRIPIRSSTMSLTTLILCQIVLKYMF